MIDGKDKDGMRLVGRSLWLLEPSGTWSWTWDFHGIFSDRAKAEALCKDKYWFVLPVVLDQVLPEEPCELPGLVVPNNTLAEPLQHKRMGSAKL